MGNRNPFIRRGYSRAYFLDRIDNAVEIATRAIDGLPQARPIQAQPVLQRIIAEQIGTLCTGVPLEAYLEDVAFYFERLLAVRILQRRPGSMMRTPRMRRARARLEALRQLVMAAHGPALRGSEEPDLIDDVLALRRADPQFPPESDLKSACLGPFLAGLLTAASVATCMLFALLKHPEAIARVRLEVDRLFVDGGPTAQKLRANGRHPPRSDGDIADLPDRTRSCANGGQHLRVRGALDSRRHQGPDRLHLAARLPRPEHFPEPERFDIDRYTPDRAEHLRPGVYAPFGLDTHRCLGSGFKEPQLALTLATMLHRAEIAMDLPDYEMRLVYSTIPAPRPGFRIRVIRRH